MTSLRLYLFGVLLLGAAACNESPTLAGTTSAVGRDGALIVSREEAIDVIPQLPSRRIVVDAQSGTSRGLATWLPNSKEITFSRDGEWMAWIAEREDPYAERFCWSDVCYGTRPLRELYVSRVGGAVTTTLTPQYSYDRAPSFSPDGQRLVVLRESYDGEERMITISRDGSDQQAVLLKSRRRRQFPDWSPNGNDILYLRPELNALYLVRPNGEEARVFAPGVKAVTAARWSPDGGKVAVIAWDVANYVGGSYYALLVLGSDGTELYRYLWPLGPGAPVWSPDGSRIAFCDGENGTGGYGWRTVVRVLTIATGETRTITPPGYSDCSPIWRP